MSVQLLRDSFELVTDREPALIGRFYDILFARYPQLKPMFGRNSRAAQEKMLGGALAAVLDHIEDAAWFSSTLGGLGAKHVAYGVTDEMYGWVGDALLRTLAEVAANDWSPEVEQAWAGAFGAIASLMQEGARLAAQEALPALRHPDHRRLLGADRLPAHLGRLVHEPFRDAEPAVRRRRRDLLRAEGHRARGRGDDRLPAHGRRPRQSRAR